MKSAAEQGSKTGDTQLLQRKGRDIRQRSVARVVGRMSMPTGEEHNALMTAVAKGDRHAFAVLFDHFAPRIAAYLMRSGTSVALAEELAQEAMVVLWRKARSFDQERSTTSAWVFAIARALRIDQHRRDGGEPLDLDSFEFADPGPSPEDRLLKLQRERRVRAALLQLSPAQHRVLQLFYFAEMPHPEIARDLRLPLGTVKSHIRRAMDKLRRLLEAQGS